ncbi:MAG TPA: hypothetical protein VFG11_07385, partial [Acidobacteriota bacterium]|nr:hypothetical protein [Acidobacteriota bacterium]
IGRYGDDLYAGKNGDVYRRTDNGWQSYNNGSWNNVDRNSNASSNMDRQASQRSAGNTRSSNASSYQRSRSSMPRGGGGGFRGGRR